MWLYLGLLLLLNYAKEKKKVFQILKYIANFYVWGDFTARAEPFQHYFPQEELADCRSAALALAAVRSQAERSPLGLCLDLLQEVASPWPEPAQPCAEGWAACWGQDLPWVVPTAQGCTPWRSRWDFTPPSLTTSHLCFTLHCREQI